MIKINAPKYLGAPEPEWAKDMINESSFVHELRCKDWSVEEQNGELTLNWIAQEDFTEYEFKEFMLEIERYFKEIKPDGIKKVLVNAYCRSTYPKILQKSELSLDI